MSGTLVAVPQTEAAPPYVELDYDSGDPSTNVYSVTATRDGEPVRISQSVTPARTAVWKDYDAPFDEHVTYVVSVGVATAPTGSVDEDWTGTLSAEGWGSIVNVAQDSSVMRTNLCPNPSAEVDASSWTGVGSATVSRTTAEHSSGAAAFAVVPAPTTVTNYVTDPDITSSTGWAIGAGTVSSYETFYVTTHYPGSFSGGVGVWQVQSSSAGSVGDTTYRSYMNSPMYAIGAGLTSMIVGARIKHYGTVTGGCGLRVRFYNSSTVQVGSDQDITATASGGNWKDVSGTVTVPTGAVKMMFFPFTNRPTSTLQWEWYLDRIWTGATTYFDGNSVDTATALYAWTGTANASTSTKQTLSSANSGAGVVTTANMVGAVPFTISFDAKRATAGATSVEVFAIWGTSGSYITSDYVAAGTVDSDWSRLSATLTPPAAADGYPASFIILFDNMGFVNHYIDAVLIEQADSARPYFDGSNNEMPATTTGAWTTAWSGTSGKSASTASFDHTIKSSGSGAYSLQKTFTFAASAVRLAGLALSTAATATLTIALSSGATAVVSVQRAGAVTTYTITVGSATASFQRYEAFTGEVDINFLDGRVYLNHVDSGASVSVPLTGVIVIDTITISANAGAQMMPFSLIPGIALTTETYTVSTSLSPPGAWLIHPYDPSLSIEIDAGQGCTDVFATAASATAVTRTAPRSLLSPVGSRRQVVVSLGPRKDPSWELELQTTNAQSYDAVVALFDVNAPLRFDYPAVLSGWVGFGEIGFGYGPFGGSAPGGACGPSEMRIPKGWYSPGDISEERDMPDWRDPARRWVVPLEPVRAPVVVPVGS